MANTSPERKLRLCVMPACHGQRFDLVHKFPMDNERAESWRRAIALPHLEQLTMNEIRKKYFICSRHFRKCDYKNSESRSLNTTAYPRLLLTDDGDNETLITNENDDRPTTLQANTSATSQSQSSLPEKTTVLNKVLKLTSPPLQHRSSRLVKLKAVTQSASEVPSKIPKQVFLLDLDETNEDEDMSSDDLVTIEHKSFPNGSIRLSNIWLRDHCRCIKCYSETFQRRGNILDIPLDIHPINCQLNDDDVLTVDWSDKHHSTYKINELLEMLDINQPNEVPRHLWNHTEIKKADYARVTLNEYLCDDDVARNVVKSLIKYGIAFIEKVPPNIQSTEVAIKRLFPIQKTFFGEMWSVNQTMSEHSDTAYSQESLLSHNDNTYFNDAAGLQVFQTVSHNGSGGENGFVDGFRAAQELSKSDPEAYEFLCQTPITAEYIEDGRHHKFSAPIIILDPITKKPQQIRFNIYDRAPLNNIPQESVKQFYSAYQAFAHKILAANALWQFKLNPGTVCIFDNWRLLHSRTHFQGKRHLCGCYVARTEFMSVARTMKLIK